MKKFNLIGFILVFVLISAGIAHFSKQGYRSNNSIMLARNMTITSTIDGHVTNKLYKIGDRVKKGDLLVKLTNNRIDKSRLIDYKSQMQYIKSEINSTKQQLLNLDKLHESYKKRAKNYTKWMLKDIRLSNIEHEKQLIEAQKNNELKSMKAARINKLYQSNHTSNAAQQIANTEASIAENNVDIISTQLKRSKLLLNSIEKEGVFFDDGEAIYWEKMIDEISLKKIDTQANLSSLKAELIKITTQAKTEQKRVNSNFTERILAPFDGIVSSKYVNNKTNVTSGTSLLQLSDCSNPVIIIPIPEHKLGDFHVGMRVSVTPLDTDYVLEGKIDFISSGPLIASDKTMYLQQEMTISGNKAIVSLEDSSKAFMQNETCDISRKTITIIHT